MKSKMDAKKAFLDEMKKDVVGKLGESFGGDKVKSLKKVTVAAPDSESLGKGLSAAQAMLKSKLGMEEEPSLESPKEEMPMEMEGEEKEAPMEEGHDLPKLFEALKGLSEEEMQQTMDHLAGLMEELKR